MTRAAPESTIERDVRSLADSLMQQHGLIGWSFGFDNAVQRFGLCDQRRQRITLSRRFVALGSPEQVRDVILHEVAHALCDGFEGHGSEWKAKAAQIGALPEACPPHRLLQAPRRWKGTCPRCAAVRIRHRRSPRYCTICIRELPPDLYPIRWKRADLGNEKAEER